MSKNNIVAQKKLPFAMPKQSADFQRALAVSVIKEIEARRIKQFPSENLQIFVHGRGWNFQRLEKDGFNPHTGTMDLLSVDFAVGTDRVRAHDPTVISDFIQNLADAFERRMMESVLKEMETVVAETGNTVTVPKTGITPQAFLQILKSIDVNVASDGTVSKPSFYNIQPHVFEKLLNDMERLGPDFKAEVDKVWAEKEKEAREREAARIARFDL